FASNFKMRRSVQSPRAKIFCFPSVYQQRILTPSTPPRGVSRSSRTRSWMRWPRPTSLTRGAGVDGQAVWFWLPDAGVNPRVKSPGGWWLKSPAHQEERGAAVKPLRRECRSDFGVPVLACVRLFCFARKAVGAACTRHTLLPLFSRDRE